MTGRHRRKRQTGSPMWLLCYILRIMIASRFVRFLVNYSDIYKQPMLTCLVFQPRPPESWGSSICHRIHKNFSKFFLYVTLLWHTTELITQFGSSIEDQWNRISHTDHVQLSETQHYVRSLMFRDYLLLQWLANMGNYSLEMGCKCLILEILNELRISVYVWEIVVKAIH